MGLHEFVNDRDVVSLLVRSLDSPLLVGDSESDKLNDSLLVIETVSVVLGLERDGLLLEGLGFVTL